MVAASRAGVGRSGVGHGSMEGFAEPPTRVFGRHLPAGSGGCVSGLRKPAAPSCGHPVGFGPGWGMPRGVPRAARAPRGSLSGREIGARPAGLAPFRSTLAVARREGREVTFATAMGRLRPAIRRGVADARARAAARLAAMALCLGAFALAGIIVSLRAFSTASYHVGPALMSISTSFAERRQRRSLRPDRRLGRPGAAVHGADPHVRDRRLGRPAGGAAHPGDAGRRAPGWARSRRRLRPPSRRAPARGAPRAARRCGGRRRRRPRAPRRRPPPAHAGPRAAAGVTAAAWTVAGCALTLQVPDYAAFRQPTFYAHGGDLPRLLELSDRLTSAGASYRSSYQQALTGLDTLVTAAAGDRPPVDRPVVHGRVGHPRQLADPAGVRALRRSPARCSSSETSPSRARRSRRRSPSGPAVLGHPTVAVSGNHDSPVVMRRLAEAGAIVLTQPGA